MTQPERLIVGLGNPGAAYARTRHNIGFRGVETLAPPGARWSAKFDAAVCSAVLAGIPCLLLKPMTMMNLSGQAVVQALRFFRLTPVALIVLHDDLDLVPGRVKVKRGGGAGGHNGLKSLDAALGPDYERVRMGIGHPGPGRQDAVTDYVLGPFSGHDEKTWVQPLLEVLPTAFPLLVRGEREAFLRHVREALGEDLEPPPGPRD